MKQTGAPIEMISEIISALVRGSKTSLCANKSLKKPVINAPNPSPIRLQATNSTPVITPLK